MDGILTHLFTSDWGTVSTMDFLLRLLVAWLAATAVGWFYSWSHGSLSYSQNFVMMLLKGSIDSDPRPIRTVLDLAARCDAKFGFKPGKT